MTDLMTKQNNSHIFIKFQQNVTKHLNNKTKLVYVNPFWNSL